MGGLSDQIRDQREDRRCGDPEATHDEIERDDGGNERTDDPCALEAGFEPGERTAVVGVGRCSLHERVEGEFPGGGSAGDHERQHGSAEEIVGERCEQRTDTDDRQHRLQHAFLGHPLSQVRGETGADQRADTGEEEHDTEVPRRCSGIAGDIDAAGGGGETPRRRTEGADVKSFLAAAELEGQQESDEADDPSEDRRRIGGEQNVGVAQLRLLDLLGRLCGHHRSRDLCCDNGRDDKADHRDGRGERRPTNQGKDTRDGGSHHARDGADQGEPTVGTDEIVLGAHEGRDHGALRNRVRLLQDENRERKREQPQRIDVVDHQERRNGAAGGRADDHQATPTLGPIDRRAEQRGNDGERCHGQRQIERHAATGVVGADREEDRTGQGDGDRGIGCRPERMGASESHERRDEERLGTSLVRFGGAHRAPTVLAHGVIVDDMVAVSISSTRTTSR